MHVDVAGGPCLHNVRWALVSKSTPYTYLGRLPLNIARKASLESRLSLDAFTARDHTSYQARAPLDDPEGLLFIGLRGKAKVHAQWQTLASRTWRYLVRTFNFKL